MTVTTMATRIADCATVETPSPIIGNSDDTARKLTSALNDAGQFLARRNDWVIMVKEHTFTTVASQADYDLPADFKYYIDYTAWDRSNFERTRGPLTPQEWQERKSSVLASTATTWKRFRIREVSGSKKYSLDPTPDTTDNMVFEYMSTSWCKSSLGTGQNLFAADTDVGVIDEELIYLEARWRFLNRLGFAYAEEKAEARDAIDFAVTNDGGARRLRLDGRPQFYLLGTQNVPDTGFG